MESGSPALVARPQADLDPLRTHAEHEPGCPQLRDIQRERAVDSVFDSLRETELFWRAKQVVKEEIIKPSAGEAAQFQTSDASAVRSTIVEALRASGLHAEIKSFAYQRILQLRRQQRQSERLASRELPLPPLPVPLEAANTLEAVENARLRWAQSTLLRLRDLSQERRQPFLRPCSSTDGARQWEGDGRNLRPRHIIDLDILYKHLTVDMKEQHQHGSDVGGLLGRGLWWGALGVQLHAESLDGLRERLRELAPENDHLGVLDPHSAGGAELLEEREAEGKALLARPYVPELLAYARQGVPPGLRQELWTACLVRRVAAGVKPPGEPTSLQSIARGVCTREWITDNVLRYDVAENCANDVCFFPFDEIVEALVLTLSRDASVASSCECGPPQVPIVAGADGESLTAALSSSHPSAGSSAGAGDSRSGRSAESQSFVPPCGVVPFRGFSWYACPFAFLADRLEVAYPLFHAFYCLHLCRLHCISCQPVTLLPLCALFESLVFTVVPHVGFHLAQLGPDAAPLRIALPWIVHGFVGFLRVEEILWLWDRIVGFDSVELVAILAAAIFAYRARLVLGAKSASDAALIFSDIAGIQGIPLLQAFLFPGDLGCHVFDL